MNSSRRITIATGVCVAALVCASFTFAARPDKPGGGGGAGPAEMIYFAYDSDVQQMKVDGTGKTTLNLGYRGAHFEPSHGSHGAGRWFIGNGAQRSLLAMKENGATVLLLTPGEDGDWIVNHDGTLRWVFAGGAQDGAVSWAASRTDGTSDETSVARALVVFDENSGDVVGIDLNSIEHFAGITEDYDWSPDGSMIVFNDQGALWIFDTISRGAMPLPVDQVWGSPVWSPDGLSVAYAVNDTIDNVTRIETIDLGDGSITILATGRLQSPLDGTAVLWPLWSPDSSSVLYLKDNVSGASESTHIMKCSAHGKGKTTNLTSELTGTFGGLLPYGWRAP